MDDSVYVVMIDESTVETPFIKRSVDLSFSALENYVSFDRESSSGFVEKSNSFHEGQLPDSPFNSPKTPIYSAEEERLDDSEARWIKVCNHRRGKHPRKKCFYE